VKIYWTSNEPINGLRHFVLVNKIFEEDRINFLMVSVVDIEVSLIISNEELLNSGNWNEGFLNLPKNESITKDYPVYKSSSDFEQCTNKIFVNNDSLFNIS
tara:strand:- start:205 stop:507 length:303 start_codon:yes stop_codon:yes gene_type:complete